MVFYRDLAFAIFTLFMRDIETILVAENEFC